MPQLLNILLQKNDEKLSWGFDVRGGRDRGSPLIVTKVQPKSFCSPYVCENDRIVQIEGIDAALLTEAEALTFVKRSGKRLNLIIHKNAPAVRSAFGDGCSDASTGGGTGSSTSESSTVTSSSSYQSDSDAAVAAGYTTSTRSNFFRSFDAETTVPGGGGSRFASSRKFYSSSTSFDDTDTDQRLTSGTDRRRKSFRNRSASPAISENRSDESSYFRNAAAGYSQRSSSSRQFWSRLERQQQNDGNDVVETSSSAFSSDIESEIVEWSSRTAAAASTATSLRLSLQPRNHYRVVEGAESRPRGSDDERRSPAPFAAAATTKTPSSFVDNEKGQKPFTVRSVREAGENGEKNISRVYLSPFKAKINVNEPKSFGRYADKGRQANQISTDKGEQYQKSPENVIGNALSASNSRSASPMPQVSVTPPPPASPVQTTCVIPPAPPAPPPPPTMNAGSIPTFRLKSEIPEKCNEPPAKIQSAMTKDKKPFTYAPGGIDFSEIKSPRMQRRLMQNAQEPEDIVLPPTSTASSNAHSLPPSAAAAMMPQIAVAVFPQFNPLEIQLGHNRSHNTNDGHAVPKTTPAARPVTPTLPTQAASNLVPMLPENNSRSRSISPPPPPQKHASTSQKVPPQGSLYIPPSVTNIDNRKSQSPPATFPTLREAPTPWLQKQQQQPQPEVIPSWVHRDNASEECASGVAPSKMNHNAEVGKVLNGTRIIPVQIESSYQSQPNSRGPSPRWGTSNEAVIHPTTRVQKQNETDQKPMPGRSFNAVHKGLGSDSDFDVNTTTYHTEGVPFSQFRKLNLNDSDQAFMNNFKPQAGNNVVIIPISGGTTNYHPQNSNNNTRNLISPTAQQMQNRTADKMIAATNDIETKKNYIPPSERQAEQELRKYMGSSIPSRSFKMLQAMTAADELSDRKDCTDF